jgi:feruloyl esterase
MGQKDVDSFSRLYMAPGMQHCSGGPGPDSFGQEGPSLTARDAHHSVQLAVERWVEKATAPAEIIATKYDGRGGATMTRPLCAYPLVAKYQGSGDSNEAGSFVCGAEEGKKP